MHPPLRARMVSPVSVLTFIPNLTLFLLPFPTGYQGTSWDGQPSSPNTPDEYVIIDNGRPVTVVYSKDKGRPPAGTTDYRSRPPLTQKALPEPPTDDDYFAQPVLNDSGRAASPAGLGRKTSLYKKVKGLGAKVSSR